MLNQFVIDACAEAGVPLNLIETTAPETYSQCGEDIIVAAMLAVIVPNVPTLTTIFYLDIGANHPIQTSNTYLLYKRLGAQGVLFEADPQLIPALKRVRPRDQVVCTAVSDRRDPTVTLHVSRAKELSSLDAEHVRSFAGMGPIAQIVDQIEVPNLHIADLLANYGRPSMQYLSIDVEGLDLAILQAIDFNRYRPWIVSCEPSGQIDPTYAQRVHDVVAGAGYTMVARTRMNMIFVDKKWL